MKLNEMKVGQKVEDTWFMDVRTGTVVKVLKTRVKIHFQRLESYMSNHPALSRFATEDGIVTYDKAHCQFLNFLRDPRDGNTLSFY